ncbi:MAG TPA: hypothetical protein VM657_08980 [Sphingomonas sp.]|nr:hypothetical protein [Sphingomonas sp.]
MAITPFVSSEVEKHCTAGALTRVSTSLDTNGGGIAAPSETVDSAHA